MIQVCTNPCNDENAHRTRAHSDPPDVFEPTTARAKPPRRRRRGCRLPPRSGGPPAWPPARANVSARPCPAAAWRCPSWTSETQEERTPGPETERHRPRETCRLGGRTRPPGNDHPLTLAPPPATAGCHSSFVGTPFVHSSYSLRSMSSHSKPGSCRNCGRLAMTGMGGSPFLAG